MVSCFLLDRRVRPELVSQKLTYSLQKCCLAVAHSHCEFDSVPRRTRYCLEQGVAKHCPDKNSGKKEGLLLWEPRYSDNPAQYLWPSQSLPSSAVAWQRPRRHCWPSLLPNPKP